MNKKKRQLIKMKKILFLLIFFFFNFKFVFAIDLENLSEATEELEKVQREHPTLQTGGGLYR